MYLQITAGNVEIIEVSKNGSLSRRAIWRFINMFHDFTQTAFNTCQWHMVLTYCKWHRKLNEQTIQTVTANTQQHTSNGVTPRPTKTKTNIILVIRALQLSRNTMKTDLSNADAVCSCEMRRHAWNFRRMPTMYSPRLVQYVPASRPGVFNASWLSTAGRSFSS